MKWNLFRKKKPSIVTAIEPSTTDPTDYIIKFVDSDYCPTGVCFGSDYPHHIEPNDTRWFCMSGTYYWSKNQFYLYRSFRENTYHIRIICDYVTQEYNLLLTFEDVDSYGPTVMLSKQTKDREEIIKLSHSIQMNLENYVMEYML